MTSESTPAQRVAVAPTWSLDRGAASTRIGLIELATAEVGELDARKLLPPEVGVFTTRVLSENPVSIGNLRRQLERLELASEQLLPGGELDAIIYNCTSGTVAIGYDKIAAEIQKPRPGVKVITPMTAALAAFRKLGTRKVTVAAPYVEEITDVLVDYLDRAGVETLVSASFGIASDVDMAKLPPGAIAEAAISTFDPRAEAVFIPCTAIRAVDAIDAIESRLGVPVVTSIQAAFWHALRSAGFNSSLGGGGRLMKQSFE